MPDTKNVLEEQLRKSGNRIPAKLPWQLLVFSFAIFGLIFASYLGMIFGYKPYLNSQISGANAQVKELGKAVDIEQQKDLTNIYSQLTNIQDLLDSHVITSTLFDELERSTYPQIYYTNFTLSLSENKLELKGISQDYLTLVKQLDFFKNSQLFNDISIDSAKSTLDGISFTIKVVLSPDKLR